MFHFLLNTTLSEKLAKKNRKKQKKTKYLSSVIKSTPEKGEILIILDQILNGKTHLHRHINHSTNQRTVHIGSFWRKTWKTLLKTVKHVKEPKLVQLSCYNRVNIDILKISHRNYIFIESSPNSPLSHK